ncbi:MAG TPA: YncE family protein [Steroidobacteraceae bacterium]|jgi:DNA-binding beta-propeller fold protein YncE
MHSLRTQFSAALGLILLATTASADQLLVLEKDGLKLAIVDPAKLTVLARVASGPDPHEVVASADGKIAYISNYGGEGSDLHIISRVDLSARKTMPPIDLGALHSAHGLDFAAGKLYFTAETSKAIGRYDPATSRIDWVLGTGQDRTHMVKVVQDGVRLYTTNVRSGSVSIIESSQGFPFGPPPPGFQPPPAARAARKVTVWNSTVVPAGRGAEGFDVSPDGKYLWTGNAQDATVTVIDLAAKKAVETFAIPVRGVNRLKFTPDGQHVLVSALGNFASRESDHANLGVIDTGTHKIVKTLDLGGGAAGILISPKGDVAYVAVSGGGKVAVVDLKTFEVRGQISPLGQPDGLAWASGR